MEIYLPRSDESASVEIPIFRISTRSGSPLSFSYTDFRSFSWLLIGYFGYFTVVFSKAIANALANCVVVVFSRVFKHSLLFFFIQIKRLLSVVVIRF